MLSKYKYTIIILLTQRDVKLSYEIQFLHKLRHILLFCPALLEVLFTLNILYGFVSFIFPDYYFPQKLCQQKVCSGFQIN